MIIHNRILQTVILNCLAVLVLVFVFAMGCTTSGKYVFHPNIKNGRNIAVFPVVPMDMAPVWADMADTQAVESFNKQKEGAVFMTHYLVDRLSSIPSMKIVTMPAITRNDVIDMQEGRFVVELPKDTDSFVLCRLYTFRDRKGGDYSVQSPSKVTFDIRVVQPESGQSLFFSEYNETQTPLLENVLGLKQFFKRKGRWLTAREMAESALNEILDQWEKEMHYRASEKIK